MRLIWFSIFYSQQRWFFEIRELECEANAEFVFVIIFPFLCDTLNTVISVNIFMFPEGYISVTCKEPNNMSRVPLSSIYVKICTVFVHYTVHHLIKYGTSWKDMLFWLLLRQLNRWLPLGLPVGFILFFFYCKFFFDNLGYELKYWYMYC